MLRGSSIAAHLDANRLREAVAVCTEAHMLGYFTHYRFWAHARLWTTSGLSARQAELCTAHEDAACDMDCSGPGYDLCKVESEASVHLAGISAREALTVLLAWLGNLRYAIGSRLPAAIRPGAHMSRPLMV